MQTSHSGPSGGDRRSAGPCASRILSRLPAAVLAAGLAAGAGAPSALGQELTTRIIIETNATDCDVGLQIFLDGGPWVEVTVTDPNGSEIFGVEGEGALAGYGGTENFLETNEPVMEELVDAFPELECDEPEFSIAELFDLFPAGTYAFDGESVEGEELEGEAVLEHVVPAAAEVIAPREDFAHNPNNVVIGWEPVDTAILPGLGRGAGMEEVTIVKYQVVVEREELDGVPAPLRVFSAELAPDATDVRVPPEFLESGALYKFEILAVDISGNQTIAEAEFETR